MILDLKKQGYAKVACAGFCYGGNVAVQVPEFDAMTIVHPG